MSRVYPILFNTAMVQALLAGRKSCTRRIVKPQPPSAAHIVSTDGNFAWALLKNEETHWVKSAYDVGDILWVRETWCEYIHNHVIDGLKYAYKADATSNSEEMREAYGYKWHPSIHMPKAAARIFLRVKSVRAEKLADITDIEVEAEGVRKWTKDGKLYKYAPADHKGDYPCWLWEECSTDPLIAFSRLWDSTVKNEHAEKSGWRANPWVWVIEFERCKKPEGWCA